VKIKGRYRCSEVSKFKWEELKKIKLAFDHATILEDAYKFRKKIIKGKMYRIEVTGKKYQIL